jgi:hypothetical protein
MPGDENFAMLLHSRLVSSQPDANISQRYDFAVDHRLRLQSRERGGHLRISSRRISPARPERCTVPRAHADGPVAVELHLVLSILAFREFLDREAQDRIDEGGCYAQCGMLASHVHTH